jgi:hypothetical protein
MGKYLLFSLIVLPLGYLGLYPDNAAENGYVETYKDIAIREMERTGIPASIKLAQAILESNAGRSTLARKANNHFGIKCGGDWKGPTFSLTDDDTDAQGNPVPSCFRVYRDARRSFVAHSDFLTDPSRASRYGPLFRIPPTDYERWAWGLQRAGYATNPKYAETLISLIRRHDLDRYDLLRADAREVLAGIGYVNDVRLAYSRTGESLRDVATRTEQDAERIERYNEGRFGIDEVLPEHSLVYLQPKRNFFRGRQKWHRTAAGETLADIAHLYGVKTEKLRERNRIPDGHEPLAGEKVALRGRVGRKEAPRHRQALPKAERAPRTEGATTLHAVAAGETLFRIAARYGVTVEALREANALRSDLLTVGQTLRIP